MQINTASGFMSMAMTTLGLLRSVIGHAPIRRVLMEPAAAAHAAHLCLHLLEQLLVARDGGKDLTQCTDVRWSPNDILAQLADLLTLLAAEPSLDRGGDVAGRLGRGRQLRLQIEDP